VHADTSAAHVARILATYNLVSVPVVDESHRLVGVVTIDDVLDYLLPDDWRSTNDEPSGFDSTSTSTIAIPRKGRRTSRGTR
jgi:Mg/Co/Ni transporter MgtE